MGKRGFIKTLDNPPTNKEFKKWVRLEGIKTENDYKQRKNIPKNFPKYPAGYFKRKGTWKGWPDVLGRDSRTFGKLSKFSISYEEYRKWAKKKEIKSRAQFHQKKHLLPKGWPKDPEGYYKRQGTWISWRHMFDTREKEYANPPTYEEYSKWAKKKEIKSVTDFKSKKHLIPKNYPIDPQGYYEKKGLWKGWPDFLGKEEYFLTNAPTYEEYRKWAKKKEIKSRAQFEKKKHLLPKGWPKAPATYFKRQGTWVSWHDLFDTVSNIERVQNYYPFVEAKNHYKKIAKDNKFSKAKNVWDSWDEIKKTITDPRLPRNPIWFYSRQKVKKRLRGVKPASQIMPGIDYYYDIYDTFGIIDPRYSSRKLLGLLQSWSEDSFMQDVDDDILLSLYEKKNLLNLKGRYAKIFNYILTHRGDKEFSKYLKETVAKQKVPTDVPEGDPTDIDEEIDEKEDVAGRSDGDEILSQPEYEAPDKVLAKAQKAYESRTNRKLMAGDESSLFDDKESYEFFLRRFVNTLWKSAFLDEEKCIKKLKNSKNKKMFASEIKKTFLAEYSAAKKLKVPKDWKTYPPTLMQRHFTSKCLEKNYYGNFSGTGAGKTLSALLASRLLNSKMTLIICPNGVVTQWGEVIKETFDDYKITKKEKVFSAVRDNKKFQYLVVNYDQFNLGKQWEELTKKRISMLGTQKIDFVILDEIHFSKTTNYEHQSKRRRWIDTLLSLVREKNRKVKVVGLSATPVVNNLAEGKSLVELLTGQNFDELQVKATTRNAMRLREKFVIMSLREEPKYELPITPPPTRVTTTLPKDIQITNLNTDKLKIEQYSTEKRIPEIIKKIRGKTIVYTEFVGGKIPGKPKIIDMLDNGITKAGFTCRRHTGDDHTGKEAFVNDKKVKVLIATKPIGTGVDDLQTVCHNIIFNNLPWTHALYTQVVGRLVRKKQQHKVKIHHIISDIEYDGKIFDYDKRRLDAIYDKRDILDCVVSGKIPEKSRVGKDTITKSLLGWMKRIQLGRRMDLLRPYRIYDLTPAEVRRRQRKYGDFEKINKKLIISKSDTNFESMAKNPEMWYTYHGGLNKTKKEWAYDPNEEWIAKIERIPKSRKIGDFGCGLGVIGHEFGAKRVKSFDLHSDDEKFITACNIKSVPLKDESVDIAIYNLSLMGKDWEEFLKEANRVLTYSGFLWIADTIEHRKGYLKRLDEVLEELDFQVVRNEERGKFFMLEAIKSA